MEKLNTRHEAIIRKLVYDGATGREVCEEFGISDSRLSILRSSPLWKRKVAEITEELRSEKLSKLSSLTDKAIQALESTVVNLNPESDEVNPSSIRLQSAKEILQRSGIGCGEVASMNFAPVIKLYTPKHWGKEDAEFEPEFEPK